MMALPFTYRVVRYVHDPAVGEMLNVGVLLYSPAAQYLGYTFDPHYGRLTAAFPSFDGDSYRRYIARLESAFGRMAEEIRPNPGLFAPPSDLDALVRIVLPDVGGSFQLGPVMAGITDDPAAELGVIFERMVTSQSRRDLRTRRSDDDVWVVYQRPLPAEVRRHLTPKRFETPEYEATFPHSFKNERWHILQPVTMDYLDPGYMQKKALDYVGSGVALEGHPDLSKLYILLGRPQNEGFDAKYAKAKDLLNKMPVPHQIIEENEARDFAAWIAEYMRQHGVISDEPE